MKRAFMLIVVVLLASCARTTTAPSAADAGPASSSSRLRYGAVMSEVGRRFELAGRAAAANRFELAAFEVDEIQELFESDLPNADLPKEGSAAALPAMADSFAKIHPADLSRAAKTRDRRAFADAFQRASVTCNGCHQASGHGFIQVPSVPGKSMPDLDPVATP